MGWSSGTDLAIETIRALAEEVPDKAVRLRIYRKFLSAMQDCDWDCEPEAAGIDPVFDWLLMEQGLIDEISL